MKLMLSALVLAGSVLVVPSAQAPANATPCNQGTYRDIWKGDVFVFDRINGEDSHYNKKDDGLPETVTVSYGRSDLRSVSHHWEVEGSVSYSWPTVKAEIKAKYGKSYVNSATTSKSWSKAMTIKDGWTGWHQAIFYRRVVSWRAYTWRWSQQKSACVKKTVAKAYWGDPKVQYVSVKKKGHVFP